MQLDAVDEQILAALAEDARVSYATIGRTVCLSASAVKRRVDRLREVGVLRAFTIEVDRSHSGTGTEAYVELYCAARTTPAVVREALAKYSQIVDAVTVSGEANTILRVRTASVQEFERLLERIAGEPFVIRTRSAIILSTLVRRR